MYEYNNNCSDGVIDYGMEPFVTELRRQSLRNTNFRTTLWTGSHLQLTVMSLNGGEDIGLEVHPRVDQVLYITEGRGLTEMGSIRNDLRMRRPVQAGDAVFVPAGTWHNITNLSRRPLKLFTVYAPPNHPHGTVHKTKEDAERDEGHHLDFYGPKMRNPM